MASLILDIIREGVSEAAYDRMFTEPNIRPMFWVNDEWLTLDGPDGAFINIRRKRVVASFHWSHILRIKVDDIDNEYSWKPPTVHRDGVTHGLGLKGK